MGYDIPGGFARCQYEFDQLSPLGSVPTWGIGLSNIPSDANVQLMYELYSTHLNPIVSSQYRLNRVTLRNNFEAYELNVSLSGEETGAPAPPNTSLLVRLSSGLTGRTNRGRVYQLGALSDSQVADDGSISEASQEVFQLAWDGFMEGMDTLAVPPVILHAGSSDPTPVTSWSVQRYAATQRRRLRA